MIIKPIVNEISSKYLVDSSKITGIVIDEENKIVPFAILKLYVAHTNEYVGLTIANELGEYMIRNVDTTNLFFIVTDNFNYNKITTTDIIGIIK